MHTILFKLFCVGCILWSSSPEACCQYGNNPLKNQRWMTYTAGMGTMDYISWTTSGSYSKRGETLLTQVKLAYSQEFIESKNDSCTSVKNRLAESGILWGDGYAWKHGYVSGALGFGFNIRFYCDQGAYEDRYLSALTIGLPAQIETGFYIGKQWNAGLVLSGNWNLRAPYLAAQIGVGYRFKKMKVSS
jgi:hypothetical protein